MLITIKEKRYYNLKVPRFCVVFNCSNNADREKHESYYYLPSVIKNNDKKKLEMFKVQKEKVAVLILQERFYWK